MYKIYCNDFLNCPYCHKLVSLYYCKTHLKTKNCKSLQELIEKNERDNLFLIFTREINKLKSELRLKEE